jgi:thioredoxin 1
MENFEETVTGDGITLVDFWAEWCGPCKMFGPIFEETADENPDLTFAKVDTEAEQQLAGALGIMLIPTLMIFRDGIQLFSQPGALPKNALDDLVRQVRELDMDEVRRELAEEQEGKVKITKLNVDENPNTSLKYQVMSIPTMLVFENGEVTKTIVGAKPKAMLMQELGL